jgi:hypothetical protein
MMKYMLYVYGYNPENDMTIECNDEEDLGHYAKSAILQEAYKFIRAEKIEDEMCTEGK